MYALPPVYDYRVVESEVARLWLERGVPRRFLQLNKGAPIFSFLEGPPTVNGYMHIGHVRGRIYKDVILRFNVLRGLDVWCRAGWDCQGLPTELEVERKLGITSKKDVESIGLERFVEEANKLVDYYISKWREDSEKLALWLDYDNAYQTRDERYMEHVWYFLKKAYDNGELTTSYKVVPFCPRCETPLSSHEVAQGYEEIEDYSIYVKLKLKEGIDRFLVIWTTTPWTLPGNEAVAINPEEVYVEVEVRGERLILAEKLAERALREAGIEGFRVVRSMRGEDLVGVEYHHPLGEEVNGHSRHSKPAHTVLEADFVTMEEGTGLVHVAPAHGPEDYELGKSVGLPIFCPINQSGMFTEDGGVFAGLYHRDAAPRIIAKLREKGLLLHEGRIVHSYPLCWRCETPLLYIASRQWFLKIDRIKRAMLEENRKVRWHPSWAGYNRFGEWLENAEDWCISRTKIWGTPLNVWSCERCGARRVVSSVAELKEAEVRPEVIRLHRPWIDRVVFRCRECGGEMYREPFVLDTWLDSGVAHFASVGYLDNRALFEKLYPYDFITEAIDQTRGWFYTLLFTSVMLFGKAPYKLVLNQGHVLDKEGKKMSKSRGNVIWAREAFERFGIDNLRLYLLHKAQPWDAVNFDPDEVKLVESTLNILWNVVSFVKTYYDLDRFDPERETIESVLSSAEPEDLWIISKINSLIKYVSSSIERMELHEAARAMLRFASEELSRTYIRSVRRRFWQEERNKKKIAAYAAAYYVLRRYLVMLSIFAPYIAEYLYQRIKTPSDPESVNFNKWPRVDEDLIDLDLEDAMQVADDVISATLNARQRAKRKLRWPVTRVIVSPNTNRSAAAIRRLQRYIERQVNAFALEILEPAQKPRETSIRVDPVLAKLGPKAGKRLQLVLEALKSARLDDLRQAFERGEKYTLKLPDDSLFEVGEEDVVFSESLPEYLVVGHGRFAVVYVDLREDERLKAISVANELIRRIQVMRKELNLEITREAECRICAEPPSIVSSVRELADYIEEETRTRLIFLSKPQEGDVGYTKEWEIGVGRVRISLITK